MPFPRVATCQNNNENSIRTENNSFAMVAKIHLRIIIAQKCPKHREYNLWCKRYKRFHYESYYFFYLRAKGLSHAICRRVNTSAETREHHYFDLA